MRNISRRQTFELNKEAVRESAIRRRKSHDKKSVASRRESFVFFLGFSLAGAPPCFGVFRFWGLSALSVFRFSRLFVSFRFRCGCLFSRFPFAALPAPVSWIPWVGPDGDLATNCKPFGRFSPGVATPLPSAVTDFLRPCTRLGDLSFRGVLP